MSVSKDFLAGLIFAALGAFILLEAQKYRLGTLAAMGPAYYPTIVGALIFLVGVWFLLRPVANSLLRLPATVDKLDRVHLRAVTFILSGIILFAFAVERLGLVPATLILVLTARFATTERLGWKGTSILTIVLISVAIVVFWYFLGLPFRLGL